MLYLNLYKFKKVENNVKMSRLCLGYLILLHLASCTSIKFKNNKMTDCELLSKIIQQISIIDEKQCNDTITLCVDTFDRSYLYF